MPTYPDRDNIPVKSPPHRRGFWGLVTRRKSKSLFLFGLASVNNRHVIPPQDTPQPFRQTSCQPHQRPPCRPIIPISGRINRPRNIYYLKTIGTSRPSRFRETVPLKVPLYRTAAAGESNDKLFIAEPPKQKSRRLKEGFLGIGNTLFSLRSADITEACISMEGYTTKKGQTFRSDLKEAATYSPTGKPQYHRRK